ncbi:MAG: ISAs1 family transposase [Ktedonobacteraceae bacterium]
MNAIIQTEAKELEGWDGQAEAHSIYEAMQQLKDRRRKQGKRYSIALIMTYLLLAKAAGETTLQATSEWIRLRGAWLQEMLPQAGPYFPCAATYSNVLRAVDPVQLNTVLMDLLTRARARQRKEGEQEHVALDGKTLRGTQGHLPEDQKKMHQVSLYETQTGIVLAEQIVGDKENELSRINEMLTPQCIKGRLVSADALHTQQAFCLGVTLAGGDYLLFAKGNQPTLHEDLRLFFHEPPLDCHDWRIAQSCDTGHGRLEMRDLIASTELNDFLSKPWTGIAQVFRLRRRVCKPLVCTQEIVYGFTSLSPAKAGPERILELVRDHWAIENRSHWRRDVTLREDDCQVRKGIAPRTLTLLNSFLLALFDWLGVTNVASQMRTLAARPLLALRLFFLSLERIK